MQDAYICAKFLTVNSNFQVNLVHKYFKIISASTTANQWILIEKLFNLLQWEYFWRSHYKNTPINRIVGKYMYVI